MPTVELQVVRLAHTGEGVASFEGRSVFIEGALPGEKVRASVTQGKVLKGELLEVLEANPARRKPPCPLADRCGGCDWLHFDEAAQREAKQQAVVAALEHLGGFAPGSYPSLPMVWGERAMGYRRRAVMHPAQGGLGFFGRRSHERVKVDRCPALTGPLESLPQKLGLAPVLKELEEVRLLESGGKVAVALVTRAAPKPKLLKKAEELCALKGVQGVSVVAPNGTVTSFGRPELAEGAVRMRPELFAQANAEVNARLVSAAVERLAPGKSERVLELYAGNGNFTVELAPRAQQVVAVESSKGSVTLGQKLQLPNVKWIEGDALKTAKGLSTEAQFDALLLDPPRTGAPGIAGVARLVGAKRVLYVACDAAALARDGRELAKSGYELSSVQVFDLFPQTRHVETLALFAR
ncbi:MAG: class I SAM-dependent RNA methyltransferase [Myxococcaceae bacterium]